MFFITKVLLPIQNSAYVNLIELLLFGLGFVVGSNKFEALWSFPAAEAGSNCWQQSFLHWDVVEMKWTPWWKGCQAVK